MMARGAGAAQGLARDQAAMLAPTGKGPELVVWPQALSLALPCPYFAWACVLGLCMCKSVRVHTHFSAMAGVRFRCRT